MEARRRPPHATAGNLDQLTTRIDRLDAKPALDESAGQLASPASDLDDTRAGTQAADRAGRVNEQRGVAGPDAVVVLGHAIEEESRLFRDGPTLEAAFPAVDRRSVFVVCPSGALGLRLAHPAERRSA